jgi:hypothetical protein
MKDKEIKRVIKEQVAFYQEKIDNILEDIDQDTLGELEHLIYKEGYGYIDEEKLQDKIIDLVRKEVRRQI